MFKRLFAALTSKNAPPAPMPAPAPKKPITAYDQFGRQIQVAPEEWRQNVLLPQLQKQWNDPDALAGTLISALDDGFAPDLVGAAQRLAVIDKNMERSSTLLAIVFLKNGRLAEARETLDAAIERLGATGVLLTNLAKVVFEESGQDAAMRVLWQAIQKDPNLENALMWWLAVERDRGGNAAYVEALRQAAALPGSWRPQLWLARHALETGDTDSACAYYRAVLASKAYDRQALYMISGDLGIHGRADLALDLVEPVYDHNKDSVEAGMNLLLAMQQGGLVERGEALLARLYALDLPPYKNALDQAAAAFQQLRSAGATSKPVEGQPSIAIRVFDGAIWQYGLGPAEWLFAQKPQDAPQIGFSAFAMLGSKATRAETQRENDVGRLTRAIPIYLAEATHYWTACSARTLLPVVEGAGPAVFGAAEGDELFDRIPDTLRWYVTGEITCPADVDGEHVIAMHLWDCVKHERMATHTETCTLQDIGAAVLRLEQALLDRLGDRRATPVDRFYARPSVPAMATYLPGLGQSLTLTLAANDIVPKSSMWGERAMLDWPLNMALQYDSETARIMYFAGLGNASRYGSEILPEFRKRTLELIRAAAPDSATARLAPIAWKVFGMHDELHAYRASLPSSTAASYIAWLDSLETR